jgi:hypothetical protein
LHHGEITSTPIRPFDDRDDARARMTGSVVGATTPPATLDPRTRRLGVAAALIVIGLAIFVALIPRLQGTTPELTAPAPIPRPLVIAILLAQPAVLALIGLMRGSRTLLVVAGIVGIVESFVAFSGVTLAFLPPSVVLIALGLQRSPAGDRPRAVARAAIAGIVIVGLVIAAWVVMLATSETVCWVAHTRGDGTVEISRVPVSNEVTLGPTEVAGGCDGGVPTIPGLLAAAALLVASSTVAWRSPR